MNKDTSVTVGCSFCGEESPDLLRCSRCKEVYYCSRECQRGHWREGHRKQCVAVNSQEPNLTCNFCSIKSNQLKKCSVCKNVSYCSKECQTRDWRRGHKKKCQKIGNTERQAIPGGTAGQNCSDDDGVPVTPYLEKCAVCGSFDKLKACQRCEKQKYCSVQCQKADWKRHKTYCLKEENWTEHNQTGGPICAYCRNASTSIACQGCKVVYYCSKFCKQQDWIKHKATCRSQRAQINLKETLSRIECSKLGLVTPEEHHGKNANDGGLPLINNDRYFCCLCNERPVAISCPDCNSDMYCSITCRDLDKETHQDICYSLQVKALSLNPSETLNRFSLGMNTFHFGFSPYHAKLPSERNPMYVQDGADLNLIVERTERSRNKAMAKAIHKFPNHILTIRIREIPTEEKSAFATNICTQPLVFLAYIRRFHRYRGRHNVYLQDSERREIYASFYLPNDDPSPHFQWGDVVPGKFIAISSPCIHFFNDKTVGLRVDKASCVYCLDVPD